MAKDKDRKESERDKKATDKPRIYCPACGFEHAPPKHKMG